MFKQIYEIECIDQNGQIRNLKLVNESNWAPDHCGISRKLAFIAECFFDDNGIKLGSHPVTIKYIPIESHK
jgi:hypothetical protein